MRKILFSILTLLSVSLFIVKPAYAIQLPTFPSCLSPQGSLKVEYQSGVHGIAGRTAEYRGQDKVYSLTDSTLMQCFCSEDKTTGIQTNWLKASNLSENEIQILKNQGWVYIPNGSLWGLTVDPYVAYNTDFSCNSESTGVGGGGGQVSSTSTSNNSEGSVLGLPSTGGSQFFISLFLLLFIFLYFRLTRTHYRNI